MTLALAVPTIPALAQTAAASEGLSLELNNAADTDSGACRMTFVAGNRLDTGLDALSVQVAVFDAQGIVQSLLVLDFGALSAGKTRIVLFDLPGRTCADTSRVVVNDVAQCRAAGGAEAPDCLSALRTGSRTAIDFGL